MAGAAVADQEKVDALLDELLAKQPDAGQADTDALLNELLSKAAKADGGAAGGGDGSGAGAGAAGDVDANGASDILAELLGEKPGVKPKKTAAEALVDELLQKHSGAKEPGSADAGDYVAAKAADVADKAAADNAADKGNDIITGKNKAARAKAKAAAVNKAVEELDAAEKELDVTAQELDALAGAVNELSDVEFNRPIVADAGEAGLDDRDNAEPTLGAGDEAAHGVQKHDPESGEGELAAAMAGQGEGGQGEVLLRRRRVWPLLITALSIFILATGGLTYFNRTVIAGQAAEHAEIQRQGDALLDESIALIQNADSVVVALSIAVDSQITEADMPRLEALLDQMDSTNSSLDLAIEKAKEAEQVYLDKDRKALAGHAQTAAGLRKQMLVLSSQLTSYDIAALRCALAVDYSWTMIVDAAAEMHAAGEAVNANGASAVPESRDYNQSAVERLTLAEAALAKAEEHFPGVDLKPLLDYVVVKKASAQLALESDLAFIDGDYTTTRAKNAEFVAKDAEAVQLALAMPEDPMSLVQLAYSAATEQLRADYISIRDQAVENDTYLRDYLGVNTSLETAPDAATPGSDAAAGGDTAGGGGAAVPGDAGAGGAGGATGAGGG